jgi:4-amino-4-deoxy-L-arabinose transferase-like glycosyltransferase
MASFQVDSLKRDFSIYRTLLLIASVMIGIGAQFILSSGATGPAIMAYAVACCFAVAGVLPHRMKPWAVVQLTSGHVSLWRFALALFALILGAGAFALSGGNLYRIEGVVLWLASILCWWVACMHIAGAPSLALPEPIIPQPGDSSEDAAIQPGQSSPAVLSRLAPAILLVGILALGLAFRYYDLYQNPLDMNSDQAEKLLDVGDVLNGVPHIFFERNTGREPWQFYWTVLLIKLFNLRPDFMALKLGTSFIGWLMLPAIYLLAREMFDKRTALIATLFAAVASWGVITARYGLRYPLAPCAVAWTMYFLVRGLRRNERNTMLAAGVCIGIGLQGYTAYRFMVVVVPLTVLAWMAWTWLHKQATLARASFMNALLAMVIAILVMMPLLRYATEHPDMLFYRAATRLSSEEQPIPGDPVTIFIDNVKNVLLMFNLTHDEVWVANLPDRPAMDNLLGGLLIIGTAGALALSIKQHSLWPALILGSGILMLIPSALSIAFPRENPSVVRTGGAMPMLMIVCAIVPGNLLSSQRFAADAPHRLLKYLTMLATGLLCVAVILVNYQRVFVDYPAQYCPRAQNASDIAREMDVWVAQGHSRSNAWLVGYPYWVDTRAVGVFIGDITFPNAVGAAVNLPDASSVDLHGQPGWFALNEEDAASLQSLKRKYLPGQARLVTGSQCAEKHFIVFTTD